MPVRRSGFARAAQIAVLICAALLLAACAAWFAAPYFVPDPFDALRRQTPVRVWTDRAGRVLWNERTWDARWRFPVPLDRISPHAVRMILAAEDASFRHHSGVDYAAVLRAAWQNAVSFRRISGASTISMQLAGMAIPGNDRSFRRKFLQAAMARKMENLHDKDEILTEYLNRIPFGGKIFGIEAAARYYFGLPASDLNPAEAAFLCGLPQKPNRFRPDRHPEAAKERQRIVLHLLTRRGLISQKEARRILEEEPLRLRSFKTPAVFELAASPRELFHPLAAVRAENLPFRVTTTLDLVLHHKILDILKAQRAALKDVHDAAAVLVDNRSGAVLVSIGTLDFSDPAGGEVDSVRAVRAAGSAVKPFLYAEAISGGLIVSETILTDAPVRYGSYSPGNYDGRFHGNVSAAYALSHSLNTPAVRLAARLGDGRVRRLLLRSGLEPRLTAKGIPSGLAAALGADGYRLLDLTRAYAMLANDGILPELTLLPREGEVPGTAPEPVFHAKACAMTAFMLRSRPFGTTSFPVAWKTGTSNNNCDAWCFAFTPDYTLGVWFGNKSGARSADLVGAEAALPAASAVFDLLYRDRPLPAWPDADVLFESRELCAQTGLSPSPFCRKFMKCHTIPGLPLARCGVCAGLARSPLKILSPAPGSYYAPPGRNSVTLNLRASRGDVLWFLNGQLLEGAVSDHEFPAGARYTLRAVEKNFDPVAGPASAESVFSVKTR